MAGEVFALLFVLNRPFKSSNEMGGIEFKNQYLHNQRSTVCHQIMLTPIIAHFFIYF